MSDLTVLKDSSWQNSFRYVNRETSNSAEEFFIDVILQRHARRLLSAQRLLDLGHFAAHLDFHPVSWLSREKDRAARVEDFVGALKKLHSDFGWPYPVINHSNASYLHRKTSNTSSKVSIIFFYCVLDFKRSIKFEL